MKIVSSELYQTNPKYRIHVALVHGSPDTAEIHDSRQFDFDDDEFENFQATCTALNCLVGKEVGYFYTRDVEDMSDEEVAVAYLDDQIPADGIIGDTSEIYATVEVFHVYEYRDCNRYCLELSFDEQDIVLMRHVTAKRLNG